LARFIEPFLVSFSVNGCSETLLSALNEKISTFSIMPNSFSSSFRKPSLYSEVVPTAIFIFLWLLFFISFNF